MAMLMQRIAIDRAPSIAQRSPTLALLRAQIRPVPAFITFICIKQPIAEELETARPAGARCHQPFAGQRLLLLSQLRESPARLSVTVLFHHLQEVRSLRRCACNAALNEFNLAQSGWWKISWCG